jgi:hypothetical protein
MSILREFTTEAEIKDSLLKNLELFFGESEAVDSGAFRQKYNSLVDSAIAVSAPFMGPETIRYQTMLLSLSIVFISISLFRIAGIKIGDNLVSVDGRLLVIYAVLIVMVSLIFLLKASLDYQRARLVRERNADPSSELKNLISLGLTMKRIQSHFWLEIFDAIGRAYKTYDEATRAILNQASEFNPVSMQVVPLDRTSLNKIAETKAEIDRLDTYLGSLVAELDEDEKQLRQACVEILAAVPEAVDDPYMVLRDTRFEKIHGAFEQYLGKWFKARNALSDKALDFTIENMTRDATLAQLNAMIEVLKRIRSIQRVYLVLEIAAPVAFAIFCILYVRFG